MNSVSAWRSIAGPVLLKVQTGCILQLTIAMQEHEAIALCDQLRRVIEDPTLREPDESVIQMRATKKGEREP